MNDISGDFDLLTPADDPAVGGNDSKNDLVGIVRDVTNLDVAGGDVIFV